MSDDHDPSRLHIDRVEGPAVFVFSTKLHDVPESKGRVCPQCESRAWMQSRFCWNCRFDFERPLLPRIHPSKLLAISAAGNVVTAAALVVLVFFT